MGTVSIVQDRNIWAEDLCQMVTEDGPCELKSSGAQGGSLENVGRRGPWCG